MSISGISSIGTTYQTTESAQTSAPQSAFSAFEQLASALQSNNLAAAQQAYTSLASLTQNSSSAQPNNQLSSDFNTLGQALQSGNLPAAQQAFAALQQAAAQGLGGLGPSSPSWRWRRRPVAAQLEHRQSRR